MRRLALVAVALFAACSNKSRAAAPPTNAPRPDADPPSPLLPKPSAVIEQKKGFGRDLPGQLDRIDAMLPSDDFDWQDGSQSAEYWAGHKGDIQKLREAGHIDDKSIDPRHLLNIAAHAYEDAKEEGGLTYGLLEKNAERYATRPWFIIKARVLDILEDDTTTMARVAMDHGRNPLFVVGRFLTNFQEGDLIDLVGFMAGSHTYTSKAKIEITIPAMAAAAIMRPGSINAMNRIARVFLGEIPEDQLRNIARKL